MFIIFYLIIPMYMGLLYMLSAAEKLPDELNEKGIMRFFYKIAAFIYRRFLAGSSFFLKSPGKRKVVSDLKTLNSKADVKHEERTYYIKKIGTTLLLLTLGALLSLAAYVSARKTDAFDEEGNLIRGGYGDSADIKSLTARDAEGLEYGDFELEIQGRNYTKEETDRLYKEMLGELKATIPGENESLLHIDSDLSLPESVPGYPFEIAWDSEDTRILSEDGSLFNEDVEKDGRDLVLTADISYLDTEWKETFNLKIYPKELTPYEHFRRQIKDELVTAEEESRYEPVVKLPDMVEDTPITWSETVEDNSPLIMLLILVAAAAIYIAGDSELSKQVNARRMKMILEYPSFISRLVLYMGAGMSVRAVFMLFSEEYKISRKAGRDKSYLYEEIVKSCHELESGMPELKVYERLGERCGLQQYTKLVTLLSQNLKKGNSELLKLLKEEASKATSERMSYARKMGEEAGTKLLVPMVMMLLIVMVVIVVPAYLSF